MTIFDTDIIIWFFRGNADAAKLIESIPDPAISIISVMELYQGARTREEIRIIRRSLNDNGFRILPLTETIGHLAATFVEEHAITHGLRLPDALIAATARETGSTLATGNARHFRVMPSLDVKPFRAKA